MTPSEETITDNNLFRLAYDARRVGYGGFYGRHRLEVRKLTKDEESREGSDWEWWFGSPGRWIGLCVQAKKLYPDSSRYERLMRPDAASTSQIDDLIKRCASDPTSSRYPLYCFYNSHWPLGRGSGLGRPERGLCCDGPRGHREYGCTLSPAIFIREVLRRPSKRGRGVANSVQDLAPISFPWDCLLCCTNRPHPGADLPGRVRSLLDNVASSAAGYVVAAGPEGLVPDDLWGYRARIVGEPPQYVLSVLEGEDPFPQGPEGDARSDGYEAPFSYLLVTVEQ